MFTITADRMEYSQLTVSFQEFMKSSVKFGGGGLFVKNIFGSRAIRDFGQNVAA